jgi:hypothetical protein
VIEVEIRHAEFPGKLLNLNAQRRGNSRFFYQQIQPWRALGKAKAQAAGLGPQSAPTLIWAYFRFADNRRRDTGNLYPTVKALVDGFVDAGVLRDDCDGVLYGPHLMRDYPNGPPRIVMTLEPWHDTA